MSFTVVRGEPTAAQQYLDDVAATAVTSLGLSDVRQLSAPQLMHHCLTKRPQQVFMTNGATGVKTTNRQMLELAVPLARALAANGLAGQRVLLAAGNHERTLAVHLALQFAGVVPFLADPMATKYELQHYMQLVEPRAVFSDAASLDTARAAVDNTSAGPAHSKPLLLAIHTDQLLDYVKDHTHNTDDYRVPNSDPQTTLVLLATSGSTGEPKVARFNSRGLMSQVSSVSTFPSWTERLLLLSTPQWAAFTLSVFNCVVLHRELLVSPETPTVEHVLHMLETYKPTWTFLSPSFAVKLVKAGKPEQFASLGFLSTAGSPPTPEELAFLKEKLPPSCSVWNSYGVSEVHGVIAMAGPGSPPGCNGHVVNVLHHKLVKSNGKEAGIGEVGELYLKGDSLISGYHKNDTELAANMADGWYRTGDEFTRDAEGRLYFQRRMKFGFNYNGQLVSPEEVEGVVGRLPFVVESVVCDTHRGPAAAVVLKPDAPADAREQIHRLVSSSLSDHKQLRGGVAFVEALPRSSNGKVHRGKSSDLVHQLIHHGDCY